MTRHGLRPVDGRPAPTGRPRTLRRSVVVVALVAGTALLAAAFARPRGSGAFYLASFAAAGVWLAAAALGGGVRLGVGRSGRPPVLGPAGLGVAAFGCFVLAGIVVDHVPVLDRAVGRLLDTADTSAVALVLTLTTVSAVGEEAFFRGTLMSALPDRWSVVASTAVYALVTAVTGNGALVLAAAALGALFALERRATGGVAASTVTHVVWSALMVLAFPR